MCSAQILSLLLNNYLLACTLAFQQHRRLWKQRGALFWNTFCIHSVYYLEYILYARAGTLATANKRQTAPLSILKYSHAYSLVTPPSAISLVTASDDWQQSVTIGDGQQLSECIQAETIQKKCTSWLP